MLLKTGYLSPAVFKDDIQITAAPVDDSDEEGAKTSATDIAALSGEAREQALADLVKHMNTQQGQILQITSLIIKAILENESDEDKEALDKVCCVFF